MKASNILRSISLVAALQGTTEVVAAIANMKIQVLGLSYQTNGAVNVRFQSGGDNITGLFYGAGNSFIVLPIVPDEDKQFWFETTKGAALNINLSGAVAVGGILVYKIVPALDRR
jgi:hypothetical protein